MDEKLQKAVLSGERARAEALAKSRQRDEEAAECAKRQHVEDVKRWRALLAENDHLYDLVTKAIAQGKNEIVMRAGIACEIAVETFPGFRAKHESGYDFINSDEVKEEWSYVTVTWDRDRH